MMDGYITVTFHSSKQARRRTGVMDRTLNLSNLYELLYNTLLITEEVKEILKKDCNEATFVLKPWQMKTIVEKQFDESTCNCQKNENEAKEIAAGISRAIILAQELREKLKLNVASKKKSLTDTIENIYLSNPASTCNRKRVSKSNNTTQKVNVAKSGPDCKSSNALQNNKVTSVPTRKSVGDTKQSNLINKIQSKSSAKVTEKFKKGKNFILENKLNVRKISSANKLQIRDTNSNDTQQNSRKSLSVEASAAELSNLIHKMVRQSTENALISFPENANNDCPLHGNNACQSVQEQIVAIDVVEALQHFNVPNEIVKVLSTYHAFLKTNVDLSHTKENKYKKSIDNFLKEFEEMNIIMQDYLLEEPHLLNKAAKSITAFSSIFNDDLDTVQSNDTKIVSTELRASFEQCGIKNKIEPVKKNLSYNVSLATGWVSNGIWNISCMEHFKNFSKVYNIRYCNKKQLLLLYEAIQKLQRTKYFNTLIEIVLRDVIPTVKSNIESASAEYAQTYKTIFVLYQGLNPKVPVLVRTDN
ncbi:uncharacterized protein LOC105831813 [Monomorium pharaonis]|uniref:uncharacterized protein LOC105831813 n=1 Tax=Monomorium pharaonis TaxID=307658 RepID=UPI00063FCAAD|nr:uncharacterized protein LOC105831813 [Monomorium pharaonis]